MQQVVIIKLAGSYQSSITPVRARPVRHGDRNSAIQRTMEMVEDAPVDHKALQSSPISLI